MRPKLKIKNLLLVWFGLGFFWVFGCLWGFFYICLLICSIILWLDLCYSKKPNLKWSCLKKKFRVLNWFWIHVFIKYKASRGETLVLRANSIRGKVITIFILTSVMESQLQLTKLIFCFYSSASSPFQTIVSICNWK